MPDFDPSDIYKDVQQRLLSAFPMVDLTYNHLDDIAKVGRGVAWRTLNEPQPNLSLRIAAKVCHAMGLNWAWVATGQGEPWRNMKIRWRAKPPWKRHPKPQNGTDDKPKERAPQRRRKTKHHKRRASASSSPAKTSKR